MLIKNRLVYLQARGKIGFSSKCPVEPAHAVNPFTSFCREAVSSAEKGTGDIMFSEVPWELNGDVWVQEAGSSCPPSFPLFSSVSCLQQ